MPTATFVHHGAALDYRPVADTLPGAVVVQGNLVGVTTGPILANQLGSIQVEGVFDFPKATGGSTALTTGNNAYWHTDTLVANSSPAGGVLLGKIIRSATDADTVVRVRMSQ